MQAKFVLKALTPIQLKLEVFLSAMSVGIYSINYELAPSAYPCYKVSLTSNVAIELVSLLELLIATVVS